MDTTCSVNERVPHSITKYQPCGK